MSPTLDAAVERAREVALRRLLEKQAELSIANRERLDVERAKLERYYDYRQRAAEDKVEAVRATFERLSASELPDVIKIVPVWAKNLGSTPSAPSSSWPQTGSGDSMASLGTRTSPPSTSS